MTGIDAPYEPPKSPEIHLAAGNTSADLLADQVVETITNTAKTGKIGDGKIFVLDIQQAVRVRTGETNADAL